MLDFLQSMKPTKTTEVLADGTIINTIVIKQGNKVTTTVETITPEVQQAKVDEAHAKAEAILAEVKPFKDNLERVELKVAPLKDVKEI